MGLIRRGRMEKIILNMLLIFILSPIQQVFSDWTGPVEVVTGSWGSAAGQFGLMPQDTADDYPTEFGIDKDGVIIIADEVNKRVQIFNPDGGLLRIINKPSEIQVTYWPRSLRVYDGGNSFLANLNIFDYTGAILSKIDIKRSERYAITNGYIIYNMDTKSYSLYSPTGALIRITTERPLELGKVKEKKTAAGYTYTVQYPDITNTNTVKTYTVSVEGALSKFMGRFQRDTNGNLYGVFGKNVVRFDDTGSITAQMQIPVDVKGEKVKDPFGASTRKPIIEEYGSAVISPTGDVYTWKRTPTAYSIIKWTWR